MSEAQKTPLIKELFDRPKKPLFIASASQMEQSHMKDKEASQGISIIDSPLMNTTITSV